MTIRTAVGLMTLLMAATGPAAACRNPQAQASTLLSELPRTAQNEPVVARVEPIELLDSPWPIPENSKYTSRIRVRVVEAIKGVHKGQTLVVDTIGTTCDEMFPLNDPKFQAYMAEWRPYIAGYFETENSVEMFRGAWTRDLVTGEQKIRKP